MSSDVKQLQEAFPAALAKLELLERAGKIPELQAPVGALRQALEALHVEQGTVEGDAIQQVEDSVTKLYRTSMAQMNAGPARYQQPIFQCYSDYQKCVASSKSASGNALCATLFALSLADSLVSITISTK